MAPSAMLDQGKGSQPCAGLPQSPFKVFLSLSLAGDGSSTGTLLAPGIMSSTHQPLPTREQPSASLARNPALMVKKQLVDRMIVLQKKVGCWAAWWGERACLCQAGAAVVLPTGHPAQHPVASTRC